MIAAGGGPLDVLAAAGQVLSAALVAALCGYAVWAFARDGTVSDDQPPPDPGRSARRRRALLEPYRRVRARLHR